MRTPTTCTKCGGTLTAGFIVDQGDSGIAHASQWQGGEPRRTWYGGIKLPEGEQVKLTTYRCDRCGYLESYALSS